MLHTRYENVKSASGKSNPIYMEINVLKSSNVRDRGHMYFPDPLFLPFLKAVDSCILEVTNQQSLEKHGKYLVEVAITLLMEKTEPRERFEKILTRYTLSWYANFDTHVFRNSFLQTVHSFKEGKCYIKRTEPPYCLLSQHVNLQTHQ